MADTIDSPVATSVSSSSASGLIKTPQSTVLVAAKNVGWDAKYEYPEVPDKFKWCAKIDEQSYLLQTMYEQKYYCESVFFSDRSQPCINPKSGLHVYDGIEVFVINRVNECQEFLWYFESSDDYNKLQKITRNRELTKTAAINRKIYRYDAMQGHWRLNESYTNSVQDNLVGYDHYLELLEKDIDNYLKHREFLASIGEVKSSNHLLYGPPGLGKTTLIKTLASKKNYPIYIVNPNNLNMSQLNNILSPKSQCGDNSPMKIVLFEDFDRFLSVASVSSCMSSILNALDGLDDSSQVIRFFTGNDCDVIFSNEALINRMSTKLQFHYPTKDMFAGKLTRMLTYYTNKGAVLDAVKIDKFLDLVTAMKITLRPFTNYIIRYMFNDTYLDDLIEHVNELSSKPEKSSKDLKDLENPKKAAKNSNKIKKIKKTEVTDEDIKKELAELEDEDRDDKNTEGADDSDSEEPSPTALSHNQFVTAQRGRGGYRGGKGVWRARDEPSGPIILPGNVSDRVASTQRIDDDDTGFDLFE
jgi:DNA polymerase III delta prime subunit